MLRSELAVAAVLSTFGALSVFPSPSPSPSDSPVKSGTVVEQTSPVGPEGGLLPGYRVARRLSGATCKTHMRDSETGNAYSCHARTGFDPCWLTAQRSYVVCLAAPYDRKVTRLHVARFINKGGLGKPASMPWGLQLSTGARTTLIPGRFGTVGGKTIHYALDSRFKTVLAGPIDKSGPVWRIRKARNNGRFQFKVTGWFNIKKAWFGEPTQLH